MQRRVEARIGQLLGEVEPGERKDLEPSAVTEGYDAPKWPKTVPTLGRFLYAAEDDGAVKLGQRLRRCRIVSGGIPK